MTIGDKLRKLRNQKGLSQEEMAEKLNISQQVYSRIENGYKTLGHDEMKKIAEVFGTTIENVENWGGTFVFNNFGQATNGQIQTQYNSTYEEANLLKDLVEQLKEENKVLKGEVYYLKTVIDRLLKS